MLEKYRAKKELQERTRNFTLGKRINYLNKILSKKRFLAEPTRDAAYSLLGDVYLKEAEIYTDQQDSQTKAIESYTKAKEPNKVKKAHLKIGDIEKKSAMKWAGTRYNYNFDRPLDYRINESTSIAKGYLKEAAKHYIKGGKPNKAKELIGKAIALGLDDNGNVIRKTPIKKNSLEADKIYALINKAPRNEKRRKSLASKLSSFIFLTGGIILLISSNITPTFTGNFLGSSSPTNTPFIISLALIIIGGFLLFKNFKN